MDYCQKMPAQSFESVWVSGVLLLESKERHRPFQVSKLNIRWIPLWENPRRKFKWDAKMIVSGPDLVIRSE